MSDKELPQTCCMNVAHERNAAGFVACDERAVHWYSHDGDICSYCDAHDYKCGEPIK